MLADLRLSSTSAVGDESRHGGLDCGDSHGVDAPGFSPGRRRHRETARWRLHITRIACRTPFPRQRAGRAAHLAIVLTSSRVLETMRGTASAPVGELGSVAPHLGDTRGMSGRGGARKEMPMTRRTLIAVASAAMLSSGFGLAALGFGVNTPAAQADSTCSPGEATTPECAPPEGMPACNAFGQCGQIWCPASGMTPVAGWDLSRCHTFYFDPNSPATKPVMISGNPPGPPPPPPPPCIPLVNCLPGL